MLGRFPENESADGTYTACRLIAVNTIRLIDTGTNPPPNCASSPCIDMSVFGPTAAYVYWSSSAYDDLWGRPGIAWGVWFSNGDVLGSSKEEHGAVRAVRGGP